MYSCIDFFNESIHAETRSATPSHTCPVESLSSPYVSKNSTVGTALLYMLFKPIEQEELSVDSSRDNRVSSDPEVQGALATSWYSPPFERTERLHILS